MTIETPGYGEILARVDLFAHLDRVSLAKLAGRVDVLAVHDGDIVCRAGDAAHGLYIVSRGAFSIDTMAANRPSDAPLEALSAADYFGEATLLDGGTHPRTIRANGDGEILYLTRQHLLEVFGLQPDTTSVITRLVGRLSALGSDPVGLVGGRRSMGRGRFSGRAPSGQAYRQMTQALTELEVKQLPGERMERVLRASVLETASLPALRALFAADADEVANDLRDLGVTDADASVVLGTLRERLQREMGNDFADRSANEAAEQLASEGCWEDALAILVRQGSRIEVVTVLGQALRAAPPIRPERASPWLDRLTDHEAAHDVDVALARATMLEDRGDVDAAVQVLQYALRTPRMGGREDEATRLASELAGLLSRGGGASVGSSGRINQRLLFGAGPRRLVSVGLAAGLVVAAFFIRGGAPLPVFLVLLGAAAALWIGEVLPDFAVGLLLIVAWVLFGLATPEQSLAGFASPNWMFIVSVLGLAAAAGRSGLLYRVGLILVRRMPRGLAAQASTLLATGVLLSPLLPQTLGRAALVGPIALSTSEGLRLKDREPAAAVLGLAAWIGAGPMLFVFLNGSSTSLLGWSLLPAASRQHMDWIHWLFAAAPLGILMSVGSLLMLFALFRPPKRSVGPTEQVGVQLAVLGPLSVREVAMIAILGMSVLGWIGAPYLGIDDSIVALVALLCAVVTGNLDQKAVHDLDWNYILFNGVALSVAALAMTLGLDAATASTLAPHMDKVAGNVLLAVLATVALSLIANLILPRTPAVLLLGLTLVPIAPSLGLDPWVVIVIALASSSMWFFPSQAPNYLVLHASSDGRLFSLAQGRSAAFAFGLVMIGAIILVIPFWRLIGLL